MSAQTGRAAACAERALKLLALPRAVCRLQEIHSVDEHPASHGGWAQTTSQAFSEQEGEVEAKGVMTNQQDFLVRLHKLRRRSPFVGVTPIGLWNAHGRKAQEVVQEQERFAKRLPVCNFFRRYAVYGTLVFGASASRVHDNRESCAASSNQGPDLDNVIGPMFQGTGTEKTHV